MDKDGYLYILDRKKDMLICSGFNVYPTGDRRGPLHQPQGERGLRDRRSGRKAGRNGQGLCGVESRGDLDVRGADGFLPGAAGPYKVPKIVEFIDQLPRTPFGKPDRRALRAIDEAKRGQVHA